MKNIVETSLYSVINNKVVTSGNSELLEVQEKIKLYILSLEQLYNGISMLRPYLLVINEINKEIKTLIEKYPYKNEIRGIYSEVQQALNNYQNTKTVPLKESSVGITLSTSGSKVINLMFNLKPIFETFYKLSTKYGNINLTISIRKIIDIIEKIYINKDYNMNLDDETSYELYKILWNNGFSIGKRIIPKMDYLKNKDSTKTLTEGMYLYSATAHYILGPIQRIFQIIVSILRNNENNIEILNIL